MLRHDAMFFVGALFLIFLIWLASGGPTHPISWAGPYLNPPAPLGNGNAYFLSGAGFHVTDTGSGNSGGSGSGSYISSGDSSIDTSAYFTNPSPYRGEVVFDSSTDGPEEQLAAAETLQIDVANDSQPVDITGWKLVSTASTALIPGGTTVPVSGAVNITSDIILQPGDSAIIGSGSSPIGVSFRENECTGYLDQYQSFIPDLDQECPDIESAFENRYGSNDQNQDVSDCEDFLNSIDQCETVTRFPVDSDGNQEVAHACQEYALAHDTYNSCVADYRGDPDFAGDIWRVYLGSRAGLWGDDHDTIRLLDASGKTVDVFAY